MAPSKVNRSSWWTSPTESNVPQLENLSLRMLSIPQQQYQYRKQLGFQFHEQNSSSTQSTGESNPEVASFQKGNAYGDIITPTQSGSSGTQEKPEDGQVVSMGMQDYALHASHLDYTQSFAGIPFPYTNSSYHGLLSAYGSQAMINHPQMMGRVALPSDFVEARPIYVNAKQYHAILRRRENRARLEAQNKLSKLRKPYLHESRHLHALKRARGLGGRFLNTKKEAAAAAAQEFKAHCCSNKKMSESDVVVEKLKEVTSTTSGSDITTTSNDISNTSRQRPFCFSGYSTGNTGGWVPHYLRLR